MDTVQLEKKKQRISHAMSLLPLCRIKRRQKKTKERERKRPWTNDNNSHCQMNNREPR